MQYSVPQFLDVEDKIIGPLGVIQLVYFGAAGAVVFISAILFDTSLFVAVSLPAVLAAAALSFYKPNGRPLLVYIANFFFFATRPNLYIWQRDAEKTLIKRAIKRESAQGKALISKPVSRSRLKELAWILDTKQPVGVEGEERE